MTPDDTKKLDLEAERKVLASGRIRELLNDDLETPDFLRRERDALRKERNHIQARCDALADALRKIKDWSDAYPREAFPEPTTEEWQRAAQALRDDSPSLDRISASNMRHVVEGVGRIAKDALAEVEEEQ